MIGHLYPLPLFTAQSESETVHARQPRRKRLRWREYENLPRLDEPKEVARDDSPNALADAAEQALIQESQRVAVMLSAARAAQENARQRADAARLSKQRTELRIALAQIVAAEQEAARLEQEMEEIDVAYITATLLND